MNKITEKRNHVLDLMKAIAIFSVVFGHILESFSSTIGTTVYTALYLFNVPFLVFVSGFLSKINFKKIITTLFIPYILLQIIYFKITHTPIFSKAFFTPYWYLWYFVSLILWRLTTPLLKWLNKHKMLPAFFVITLIIGLYAGFLKFLDRRLSLSRTLVFYPYFVLGYCFKSKNIQSAKPFLKVAFLISGITFLILSLTVFKFPKQCLYCAQCYNSTYNVFSRLLLYLTCFCILLGTYFNLPDKSAKISDILALNSMAVYVWHAPFVILMKRYKFLPKGNLSVVYALLLAIIISYSIAIINTFMKNLMFKIRQKISR